MRRSVLLLLIAMLAGGAHAATHDVTIGFMSFSPAELTIAPGDTVRWTMQYSGFHTTTSNTGVWDSPYMSAPGESFSFTFQNAGTFPYYCRAHSTPNGTMMNAVITVSGGASKVGTSTTLESSANPSVQGQNATLTATVTKTGASDAQPSGTVTFTSDGSPLCNAVTLSGGTASCSTASLTAGTHTITASYSGDTNFEASTSTPLLQTVNPAPAAPTGLVATASGTTHVALTWNAVNGATSYEVHRSSLNSAFALRVESATTNAIDNAVSANVTYVYKVRAMSPGAPSAFSAAEAATTIVYTDAAPTIVRAVHVTELRTGVNAMRAAAGLGGATYTDDPLPAGTVIRAVHWTELRNALDQARTLLALPALVYTNAPLTSGTTPVRAVHATELRAGTQ